MQFRPTALLAILAASVLGAGFSFATPSQAQGSAVNVSIVSGSSSLTNDAYEPNPVSISVGETVVWTNDDSTAHTVTSGSNAQLDGKFDSSPNFNPLMAPGQTFSHTFNEAGEFPYYCALHPNMVGTVTVGQGTADLAPAEEPEIPQASVSPNQTSFNVTAPTLDEAYQLYLTAWNNTGFNATFNTFIVENSALGFGIYQERGSNAFGPGEAIVLYVEPVGFGHLPSTDDRGNTTYFMNMTADYVISDSQGNELQRIPDISVGNFVSHRQNTELFLELTLTQTEPLPEGNYVITYIVHDNVLGQSFEIPKNVQVIGPPAAGDLGAQGNSGNETEDDADRSGPSSNSGSSPNSGPSSNSGPSPR